LAAALSASGDGDGVDLDQHPDTECGDDAGHDRR
jgi:hypothetical protein